MNFDLPDHVVVLQDTLRKFMSRHMSNDAVARWDKDGVFPRDVFDALAETGVMGLTVSEDYGGVGPDVLATMVAIEELSRGSLAVAIPYIMAACYAGMNLTDCGSEQQKRDLLPQVAAGRIMFAYGLTEPDVGADLASVRTTAVRNGDHIVVNGAKRFCTGAEFSDFIYTLVRSDQRDDRRQGLSLLLIPSTAAGVSITRMDTMGLKGTATADVSFVDVAVPADNIVGGPEGWNCGWAMLSGPGLNVEKLEVAAMALGIAQAALDQAWAYAEERRQFGKLIGEFQSVRHKLVDMRVQLEAARLMMYHAAWRVNKGRSANVESSMAKLFVTEAAKTITLEAQTVMGAYGYSRDFPTERYLRDALVMPIIGGSSAIQKNNIAKGLGLAR